MEAPEKVLVIKAWFTAVIGTLTALWGPTGWIIIIFFACIILDYITGTWAAMKNGEWSSTVARQGLWHKLGEIVALLVAVLVDIALKVLIVTPAAGIIKDIPVPETLCTILVSVWYIFTELGSIIENAGDLGAPIPEWLRKIIAKLRNKAEPEIPEDKDGLVNNKNELDK